MKFKIGDKVYFVSNEDVLKETIYTIEKLNTEGKITRVSFILNEAKTFGNNGPGGWLDKNFVLAKPRRPVTLKDLVKK